MLPPEQRPILSEHFSSHDLIKTLAPVEIFAGKINALLNRAAARDLYDVTDMIRYGVFDESEEELLRKCVVFYAAISAQSVDKGFSTTMLDRLTEQRIRTDLLPVLRRRESFDLPLAKRTIRAYVSDLMRLTEAEVEFLERFENREFRPELLFDSEDILSRLAHHPMALWKTRRM
ncbi:MAG: nucleotidyl transferase AbiEii/AbiGii toxin family protein [Limnochordia bacterium]